MLRLKQQLPIGPSSLPYPSGESSLRRACAQRGCTASPPARCTAPAAPSAALIGPSAPAPLNRASIRLMIARPAHSGTAGMTTHFVAQRRLGSMGIPDGRPWIELGTSQSMALIFACPGREELEANPRHPAAGQTGGNLEVLLQILTDEWGVSQFRRRTELTITNSWPGVLYGKPTVPPIRWVKEEWNLLRLKGEIGHIQDWIICFGAAARKAALELRARRWLQPSCQIVCGHHPAFGGINRRIKMDLDDRPIPTQEANPEEINQTYLRLEVVAACLLRQMELTQHIRQHLGRAWASQCPGCRRPPLIHDSDESIDGRGLNLREPAGAE